MDAIGCDLFYDYNCPFVYRASTMLLGLVESKARNPGIQWRYFSLTQVNSRDEGWTVWDAPAGEAVKTILEINRPNKPALD